MPVSQRIDAHQHFWKIARGDYDWMGDEVAAIRRDILPADLAPSLAHHNITGTVVVQAAATVAETEFLLTLAQEAPFIKGVVGWVDLADTRVTEDLDRLQEHRVFKGVRPMLQDIEDTHWITQPVVLENLAILARRGLRLDALITPRHLPVLLEVAQKVPNLPIVIDHCAKPEIAFSAEPGQMWRDGITQLARCPQVYCKLSGLANEAGPDWTAEKLRPTVDHVLNIFGPRRLMWGSDWPVLNLAGDYDAWSSAAETLLGQLPDDDQAEVFGRIAARFYDLETT